MDADTWTHLLTSLSIIILAVTNITTTKRISRLEARIRALETSALQRAVRDYIASRQGQG